MDRKRIQASLIMQQDASDCGVSCLAMLLRWHGGGDVQFERLREVTGTTRSGTTILGVGQGAESLGFEVDYFEAENIGEFRAECKTTAILHIRQKTDRLVTDHFVVYLGFEEGKFQVLDPAMGQRSFTEAELTELWQSRALITVSPGPQFKPRERLQAQRRNWVRSMISDDLNILGVILFLGFFMALLSMSFAVFSKVLIDDILPNESWSRLWIGIALLFFLMLVHTGLTGLRSWFLLRQNLDFNNRILKFFFTRLLRLPKSFFDNRKTGDLIARMNDTGRIQAAIANIGTSLMIDVMMALIAVVTLLFFSWKLGLISLAMVPLIAWITMRYSRPVYREQREVMAGYAASESNFIDVITGVGVVKGNNREEVFSGLTFSIYGVYQDRIFRLGLTRIRFTFVTGIVSVLFNVGIISLGAWMVMNGELLLGSLMGVIQVSNMLMPAVARISGTNIQLQEARAAFERMFEFISIDPESDETQQAALPDLGRFESLQVRDLVFRYPGREALLNGVNFELKQGQMIAILGESGSGKSTLLQVLQKFYRHESGSLLVNGRPWETVPIQAWRRIVATVPQDIKIFNSTVLDNVCLGEMPGAEGHELQFVEDYGFDKFLSHLPQGMQTLIGENGINLSGGQQQLVALMRALYKKPQVLILDEATSAMDRDTERFVLELLHRLRSQLTIIMVTHRVQTARRADFIYVLENGNFSTAGEHEELIKGNSLYARAWNDLM